MIFLWTLVSLGSSSVPFFTWYVYREIDMSICSLWWLFTLFCREAICAINLRCFVARPFLSEIYALLSVKFSGLKMCECKQDDKYQVCLWGGKFNFFLWYFPLKIFKVWNISLIFRCQCKITQFHLIQSRIWHPPSCAIQYASCIIQT